MPIFDGSVVSPTRTCTSYVCKSKDDYLPPIDTKYVEYSKGDYDFLWNASRDSCIQSTPSHISKLRTILSETISHITKDNQLNKGESVELTLEIELVSSQNNTPTHSLVEVTIIQHNKGEDHNKNGNRTSKMITDKMPFHIDVNNSQSESASQKRRNWFHRVINNQNADRQEKKCNIQIPDRNENNHNIQNADRNEDNCKTEGNLCTDPNCLCNREPRNNFICVLPDNFHTSYDFMKGYQKVSPQRSPLHQSKFENQKQNVLLNKRTPLTITKHENNYPKKLTDPKLDTKSEGPYKKKSISKIPLASAPKTEKSKNTTTPLTKKDSLVKKLSDLFLPSKKPDKNKAVKTALTELKNEVDNNMKSLNERANITSNKKKKQRAPVHNLGKLVSNILVDMLDSTDTTTTQVKPLTAPYKSFFEPLAKLENKKVAKVKKEKMQPSFKKVVESCSDTCCLNLKSGAPTVQMKSSNSVSDCRKPEQTSKEKPRIQNQFCQNTDNLTQKSSNKKQKRKGKSKKYNRRNASGDSKSYSSHKLHGKNLRKLKRTKSLKQKKSTIDWNGEKIQINREIKRRIELLIINELQNLALKEGMECDVTPLPSTDESSKNINTVEKVTSYICELDISDKKFSRETMKYKKSQHDRVNVNKSSQTKRRKSTKRTEEENKSQSLKGSSRKNIWTALSSPVEIFPFSNKPNSEKAGGESSIQPRQTTSKNITAPSGEGGTEENRKIKIEKNDVEVTYINLNVKNWSTESHTVPFKSPQTCESESTKKKSELFTCCGDNNCINKNYIASGFVKRIDSSDSTWNKSESKTQVKPEEKACPVTKEQVTSGSSIETAKRMNSQTSNECQSTSSIEFEVDIKELELIIKEAKEKHKASKVVITAKARRNGETTTDKKSAIKFYGKNSPSYTNQLLIKASKKLEKYSRRKK